MTTQHKALRLADWLDGSSNGPMDAKHKAAAELRRLHALNQELLEALKGMADLAEFWFNREDRRDYSENQFKTWHALGFGSNAYNKARAAIAKAEGRA